ncbi:heme biosynthesis HemY N-terminal domain-containing protein [Pseudomonas sp. 10B1]|uniref:heme biosynthesis HemY N-terminal domain-containing protein n=1 Tax=unclassified Pseudomonas TaxID=196821 RepID=UPI002AB58B0E|nr:MULTISPECIES: heme biosynthesis HemY N-terminal domain-containing protein [unclassified Pseudomonas]MDY7562766.1 heme biosynthesis HemY N-terminal domain-containing protein [Pseudomonas sp. AB6]MEA9977370.1 heme biosynthesis HemY N-terminal domain-containing protein [Pseudomonas sp. RTS4]MEA9994435.1 heme biosynthesis HemY N-terminal domain-containing protein [Pseudomonas sp. AA4]MEB0087853.1 heme biosynthesis HemY N-terminal domain-containing protein [Pseudomonas sp. RTI1]MEB0126689.1 heme
MKRVYLILFAVIAVAALIGVAISQQSGYVLISYQNFRYESSLWATLGLLLLIWLVVFVVRVLLNLVTTSSGVVNPWSRRNRSRRVQQAIEQGQLDLAEGRWASAQGHLQRAAEADRQPLLYYLGAARAANELGRYEDSDSLLERALERQPHAELAIALSHAQLQLDRGDNDGARATLEAMHERHPRNPQVLRQLQRLYQQQQDWAALIRLMPELRKDKVLPSAELLELERRAWGENLTLAAHRELEGEAGLQSLNNAWKQLSSAQRQEPPLVLAYAEQLRQLGADGEAEEVLRGALKRDYNSHLARFYGLLRGNDPARQLQMAEGWLKQHPADPSLLLTLGRLCLQSSLWGKARDYLEDSLRLQRNPEACAELARLLAQLGETDRSNQLFQEGLGLLDERLLARPLPALARA